MNLRPFEDGFAEGFAEGGEVEYGTEREDAGGVG